MQKAREFDCPVTMKRCEHETCKRIACEVTCQLDAQASERALQETWKKKIAAFERKEAVIRPAGKREENAARKRLQELDIFFMFRGDKERCGELWEEYQTLTRRFDR